MIRGEMTFGGKSVAGGPAPRGSHVAGLGVLLGMALVACSGPENGGEPPRALTPEQQTEYVQQIDIGRQLIESQRPLESLPALTRSAELDPGGFAAHNNLCVAYGMLQRRDEAVAACERALKINPEDQLAKNNLAWVSGLPPAPAR